MSKERLACTSLGFTFVSFLAIICYHIWKRLQSLKRRHCNGYQDINDIQAPPQGPAQGQSTTYQEVSVPELRESLLESVTT